MLTQHIPTLLEADTPFPPVEDAGPEGLLAVGGNLSIPRLQAAYRHGIFPWFLEQDPILWWTFNPRMVLFTENFKPSKSLAKTIKRVSEDQRFEVTMNKALPQVMNGCSSPRKQHTDTWITPKMKEAYYQWHLAGQVHSIETWFEGRLVGGLYGVSLGRVFFGESMFAQMTDASKIAFAYLVNFLRHHDVPLIDCQQQTEHLRSLGAAPISQPTFQTLLTELTNQPSPPWKTGTLYADGTLC